MEANLPRIEQLGLRRPATAALLSGLAATVGVCLFWGFTVDDALITARVAHQIAVGRGYRFNASGPIVDAVTPLGWAYVIAPFAQSGPLAALTAARLIGVASWLVTSVWLGRSVARRGSTVWPLALLALLAPVGFWASAGMETGVIIALVTLGTAPGSLGACSRGLAAAWRPELVPFAATLGLGQARSLRDASRNFLFAVGPAVLVGLIRWGAFGTPGPLALTAKPSDLTHGCWYALEALLWSGPIWLWFGLGWPLNHFGRTGLGEMGLADVGLGQASAKNGQWSRFERQDSALVAAILVHFVAVALAGGDWMPAYRLAVPVMPAMLVVACHMPRCRWRLVLSIGVAMAVLAMGRIAFKLGPTARHIVEQRLILIKAAAESLHQARVVAAPDVGWVGASFPGVVVDLAGTTDPTVAQLRGGHTSKQIGTRLFVARHVDRVIVLLAPGAPLATPWTDSWFARAIDRRAAFVAAELGCAPDQLLELPFTSQKYLILTCPNP